MRARVIHLVRTNVLKTQLSARVGRPGDVITREIPVSDVTWDLCVAADVIRETQRPHNQTGAGEPL